MPTNVDSNDMLAQFAPKVWLKTGCKPVTAYNSHGGITWLFNPDLATRVCHKNDATQMYGRKHVKYTDHGIEVVLVYAWLDLVEFPVQKVQQFVWQWMAVLPKMVNGKPANTGTAIWTPVDGHADSFPSDANGRHPHVQQVGDQFTAAGIAPIWNHQTPTSLESYPLIDVDAGEVFTFEAKLALDLAERFPARMPPCPLSQTLFEKQTIVWAKMHDAIGHPQHSSS